MTDSPTPNTPPGETLGPAAAFWANVERTPPQPKGDYTCALAEKQEFERFPDLAVHIERMAVQGQIGNMQEWDGLLRALNEALTASQAREARAVERITTAAIHHSSGVIVTVERPYRHGECINFLNRCGLEYKEGHGFLTSEGRFVDRKEAAIIAEAAGQGQARPQCNGHLFSEDLWADEFIDNGEDGG